MNAMLRRGILGIVSAAGLLLAGPASAFIITGSGIDTVAKHFVIDGTMSSVTHDPGFSFGGATVQTYAVAGEFDATFSRYWWTYFQDGDVQGSQGTFILEQNWLAFSNPDLSWTDDPGGFVFPNYLVRILGTNLVGDEGVCNFPSDPNTLCSGWNNGLIASLSGTLDNGKISLQGAMPVLGGNLFENFAYDIQANAIPEPGMLALFLTGLGGLIYATRRKQLRRQASGQSCGTFGLFRQVLAGLD